MNPTPVLSFIFVLTSHNKPSFLDMLYNKDSLKLFDAMATVAGQHVPALHNPGGQVGW